MDALADPPSDDLIPPEPTEDSGHQYPDLPAANEPPPKEVAQATTISFSYPGKRIFTRPWSRLIAAGVEYGPQGQPVLVFVFPELEAKLIFTSEKKDLYLSYWQSYLDGKLAIVVEKSPEIQIIIRYANVTEKFKTIWPPGARGGGAEYTVDEDANAGDTDGEGEASSNDDEDSDGF